MSEANRRCCGKRTLTPVPGIERLEERDAAELREELEADLRDHHQRLADLRASDLGALADRLDADPRLQGALSTMRAFVEDRP
ncbi:MAG: hypothetical protein DI562_05705 [Stenotrophomonas acidaminiphila]|nr:MAG: hypothetical protein DI562_05705 [Stenotrophomonas acidaminiphila]